MSDLRADTRSLEIAPAAAPHRPRTVRAAHVLRATEGFTANLRGEHRTWLPMNSSMIVTEPLPASVWAEIGWEGRETLGDFAHVYMYAQRTADDRIAFGGRGVPYRYGSRVDTDGTTQHAHDRVAWPRCCGSSSRMPRAPPIDHAWCGCAGRAPRLVRRRSATTAPPAWAGQAATSARGVTATNLAGRTLRDLVLGRDTELTHLPWVGHRSRNWELEPLRFIAVHGIYAAYRAADRSESRGRRTDSPLARIADVVSGRSIHCARRYGPILSNSFNSD